MMGNQGWVNNREIVHCTVLLVNEVTSFPHELQKICLSVVYTRHTYRIEIFRNQLKVITGHPAIKICRILKNIHPIPSAESVKSKIKK